MSSVSSSKHVAILFYIEFVEFETNAVALPTFAVYTRALWKAAAIISDYFLIFFS